jgi:hypothetical protein
MESAWQIQPVARFGPRACLLQFGNVNGGTAPSVMKSGSNNLHGSVLRSLKN